MRLLLPIFAVFSLSFTAVLAQDSINTEKLNRLLETLAQEDKYMGSVAVLKNGEIVYHKATGYSGMADGTETWSTPTTKYRIGSISKMFTATMIFQLLEEGKLSLDTKLAEFFPDIQNAEKITIRHMLRHNSGLHNFTNDAEYQTYFTKPKTREEMTEIIARNEPDFEIDEGPGYSNANYVLLGYIIEDLDNRPYHESLKDRIIYRSDLKHTYYGTSIDPGKGEAESFAYKDEDEEWVLQPETDMSIPGGAGAIVSTSGDLARFAEDLFTGKLISEKSVNQMKEITQGYGMGIFQFPFGDRIAFGHNGGIDGFVSHLSYFPADSVAVAMVSNGLNYNQNDLMVGILSIAYGMPYEIPEFVEVEVPIEQLDKYTGTYATDQLPLDLKVYRDGDQLMGEGTDQPAFPLNARSTTTFAFDRAGIMVEFIENDLGEFESLVLSQGGEQYRMEKTGESSE